MIRVIAFANQKLGIDCIKILQKNKNVNLVAVVGCETDQDIKQGYPSIRTYSRKNKLPFYNPEILDDQFLEQFKLLNPDLCFGLMYRNVFNENYLKVPKLGFINFHPSLLPKYRGPIPWVWAMINGETKTGLTMLYMDKGIDTGDIIAQSSVGINDLITGFELLHKIMDSGTELFIKQLPLILKGKNSRIKQNHKVATYYGPFHVKIRTINWLEISDLIIRKINAVTKPYQGARANIADQEIIIWKAKKISGQKKQLRGPGKVIKLNPDGSFIVTTVDGFIRVYDYQIDISKDKFLKKLDRGSRFLI